MELIPIQQKIYSIRDQQVMLDFDLAELFELETRRLNEQVKRNLDRFPKDFMFQLNTEEWNSLKSQFATSSWGGSRKLPFAFTEHGVTMLASVLRSARAVQMNIAIVRAFIAMRSMAMHYKDLAKKIIDMEDKYDGQFLEVYDALKYLMDQKQTETDWADRDRIGFKKA